MLKRFFNSFKKTPVAPDSEVILLTKIDKHMNFILRDKLGSVNKSINTKILEITEKKEEVVEALRELHKAKLMNANIPERERTIMEGNRDNYIKRIAHIVTNLEIPKNYLDTHDYCVKFSQEVEHTAKEIQKNIFVLQHFYANEVGKSNKTLHDLEERIIELRVILEKNGIMYLKQIQKDIKKYTDNILKTKSFNEQIDTERHEIMAHQDRLDKLNERIHTITNGPDFKALESFKEEKTRAESEMKKIIDEISSNFSNIDTALKKYYYSHPDRKIVKQYLDSVKETILVDLKLEIAEILVELKGIIERDEIDLKDKKKESCLENISKLTLEYLKDTQSKLLKLDDERQRAQTKITHNSASLNLSEQQYWITATEEKIKYHNTNIDKLKKNIDFVIGDNSNILEEIRQDLEKVMEKTIIVQDDLTEGILRGENIVEE